LVLVAHQLALTSPFDARYSAVLERALYNAVLVGMSVDGRKFFYDNPLATIGKRHARKSWFEISCCPPNVSYFPCGVIILLSDLSQVARLLGSLNTYVYAFTPHAGGDTLHVRMYLESEVELVIPRASKDGINISRTIKLQQSSGAPWTGGATFQVKGDVTGLKISLPRPEWAIGFEVGLLRLLGSQ
jgi:DUF1680 family protein